jgi:hypothetical protein
MSRASRARNLAAQATNLMEGIFTPYNQMAADPEFDLDIFGQNDVVERSGQEDVNANAVDDSHESCMGCMKKSMGSLKSMTDDNMASSRKKAMSYMKAAMSAYMSEKS